MSSLGKTLLAFVLLNSVLQGKICLLLQESLDFLLFIPVPYDEKDIFKVLKVFTELFYFTFFGISQSYGFSSSHVLMWELDHKEG